jgi:peroxiredoxin Q/BCP
MLETATQAPSFALPDQDGNTVALDDLRGRWVLLWWYPKAATPG